MEFLEVLKSFASNKTTADRIRETPNAANKVQYPEEFNNKAMIIAATPVTRSQIATIIIATQTKGYTEYMFNEDVETTCHYFGLEEDNEDQVQKVLLKPISSELDNVLDSVDAIEKMKKVVDLMNIGVPRLQRSEQRTEGIEFSTGERIQRTVTVTDTIAIPNVAHLRIISLGVKSPGFIIQALEYMLNHWTFQMKNVQFVTNGELEDQGFLNFWYSACILELCTSVEYVRLDHYLPFGYFKGKCKKLYKSSF